MSDRLAEIKARCDKATRGPWRWNVNLKAKHIYLEACVSGFEYVMDFVRWGMGGAKPRFKVAEIMKGAEQMATTVPSREHHKSWYRTICHPDADFIANSRDDIPWLIAELEKARREQMEADCRAVCRFCENGHSLQFSFGHAQMPNTAHWRHPEANVVCRADAIRKAFEDKKNGTE